MHLSEERLLNYDTWLPFNGGFQVNIEHVNQTLRWETDHTDVTRPKEVITLSTTFLKFDSSWEPWSEKLLRQNIGTDTYTSDAEMY